MHGSLSKITVGNRKTYSLKINTLGVYKLRRYFSIDDDKHNFLMEYTTQSMYKWSLYIKKRKTTEYYYVYGVCGDSTFGLAPYGYKNKYGGNLRNAKEVLGKFINMYGLHIQDRVEIEKFKKKLSLIL
jgi:hypothetical protein